MAHFLEKDLFLNISSAFPYAFTLWWAPVQPSWLLKVTVRFLETRHQPYHWLHQPHLWLSTDNPVTDSQPTLSFTFHWPHHWLHQPCHWLQFLSLSTDCPHPLSLIPSICLHWWLLPQPGFSGTPLLVHASSADSGPTTSSSKSLQGTQDRVMSPSMKHNPQLFLWTSHFKE